MQRYIRLIAHHPAVVRFGGNMEERTRSSLPHAPVSERSCRAALKHEPHMLHATTLGTNSRPDIDRPPPARFVGRATQREATDAHELKPAAGEMAYLVRCVKALENDVEHSMVGTGCGAA